jgi:uncharacterized membrane protein
MPDWYAVFKFLHIAAAICWIGGGMVLMTLGILAERRKDTASYMTVIKQVTSLATVWFIPSSLATLIFGIVASAIGGLWSEAWVILGLVGFAATFATGNFLIKPTAERIEKLDAEGHHAAAEADAHRMLQVSKFDYVMLFSVVALMVLKPGWGDIVTLGIIAVVIAAGGVLFLRPVLSQTARAA